MKQYTLRILNSCGVAIAACGVGIYNAAHRSSSSIDSQLNINYQAHPVASLIGSIIPGIIAGFGFYWLSSWRAKRKQEKLKQVVDDKFYDEVARELQEKSMVAGLWTKAYAEMNGDEAKTRALYIKYRVVQLKNESESKVKRPPKLRDIAPNPIFAVFFILLTLIFGASFLGLFFSPDPEITGIIQIILIILSGGMTFISGRLAIRFLHGR